MEKQPITFTQDASTELRRILQQTDYDHLFVLTDDTTRSLCLPKISSIINNNNAAATGSNTAATGSNTATTDANAAVITIPHGDTHKNVESLAHVWEQMGQQKGSRRSLLVNLGGGMVTDLGGFAASTFKRGIPFINVPTTLLAMVDASVGGKTGINFHGLKNEVGVFRNALHVIIDTTFLNTLDEANILSGYAEMIKHGLISNTPDWAELMNFEPTEGDHKALSALLEKNIQVKERIVMEDPLEQGIRKALNVGHTAGHALESYAMETGHPVLHGYAVAWGMICELYLSATKMGFPKDKMRQTISYIRQHYGLMPITCDDYPRLYELMTHDKKNTRGFVNFTLLSDVGRIHINQSATREEIYEMLDFYREGA